MRTREGNHYYTQCLVPDTTILLCSYHYSQLGVSTGRAGSGLCPTRNRPDLVGWIKIWPETDPNDWPDFSVRVLSVSGFFAEAEIWPIRRDLAEIWPDPAISGRNLARSNEIWPDPSRSGLDFVG